MLVVLSVCQPGCALCLGFCQEGSFKLPPWILDGHLTFKHEIGAWSCPSVELIDVPMPFHQVGYGSSHRALDHIPWALALL